MQKTYPDEQSVGGRDVGGTAAAAPSPPVVVVVALEGVVVAVQTRRDAGLVCSPWCRPPVALATVLVSAYAYATRF